MPPWPTAMSNTEIAADGTRSSPSGPGRTLPLRRPGRDSVPRTGTGRVCGTAAGMAPIEIHCATCSDLATSSHIRGQLAPAEVGLRAGQHHDVAPAETAVAQRQLGPLEAQRPPINDVERGPARAVVVQDIVLERRQRLAAFGQRGGRRRGGRPGIDPGVESDDHRR